MTAEWVSPYLDRLGESVDPPAFSNGTMHEMWSYNYCPLIALAFVQERVEQWVYTDKPWPMHVHCIQFTADDVRAIRDGAESGMRHGALADEFGVSRSLVSQIVRREIWRADG